MEEHFGSATADYKSESILGLTLTVHNLTRVSLANIT